jgi:hypothetical protein
VKHRQNSYHGKKEAEIHRSFFSTAMQLLLQSRSNNCIIILWWGHSSLSIL